MGTRAASGPLRSFWPHAGVILTSPGAQKAGMGWGSVSLVGSAGRGPQNQVLPQLSPFLLSPPPSPLIFNFCSQCKALAGERELGYVTHRGRGCGSRL